MNFNASSGDNLHFDVLRLSKVCYVWAIPLKNDAKFEEELSCTFLIYGKWQDEFGQILIKYSKVSKLAL